MEKNKKSSLNIINFVALLAAISSVVAAILGVVLNDTSILEFKESTLNIGFVSMLASIGILTAALSLTLKKKQESVFMIYSYNDKEKTNIIKTELIKNGVRVLTDDDVINIGDNINSVLKKYIERSSKIIIVLSKNTKNSDWINSELNAAISAKKQIFPVKIENVDIPESIKNLKYADLSEINDETITPLYKAIIH